MSVYPPEYSLVGDVRGIELPEFKYSLIKSELILVAFPLIMAF